MQVLIEVVMTGNIMFLTTFLMQADPSAAALHDRQFNLLLGGTVKPKNGF
jgi:hypothetical protein